jgi:hypothetical protein
LEAKSQDHGHAVNERASHTGSRRESTLRERSQGRKKSSRLLDGLEHTDRFTVLSMSEKRSAITLWKVKQPLYKPFCYLNVSHSIIL